MTIPPNFRACRRRKSIVQTSRQILRHTILMTTFGLILRNTATSTDAFSLERIYPAQHRYRRPLFRFKSCLRMKSSDNAEGGERNKNTGKRKKKKVLKIDSKEDKFTGPSRVEAELLGRVGKLEELVARQEIELQKLRHECSTLAEAATAFGKVVELLRQAGLETPKVQPLTQEAQPAETPLPESTANKTTTQVGKTTMEFFDDSEIFGTAPASVIDAADSAGAAILAGMLGGKQRMLVDVRDAELSRDPETLVQFIELAILPVAAGLEGLKSARNRVKIVFPTVSQLLQYRRTMALAAPDVVTLSTLGFDPIEKQDNIVVIVAPSPDDEEGLMAMNELLEPTDPENMSIGQPLVILNHHMVPVTGPAASFEVAYHLRLLSVQFMTGNKAPENFQRWDEDVKGNRKQNPKGEVQSGEVISGTEGEAPAIGSEGRQEDDEALEAAMKHAAELGVNQGVTRAMVIRAFPRPWHVFVDTSPDSDADFEVAATFDEEPSQEAVNYAIVECLEGSEHEDEIVAQQMQQALEEGQLDRVSEMLGTMSAFETSTDDEQETDKEDTESDDSDNDGDDATP